MSRALDTALSRIGNQYHKILLVNLTRLVYTCLYSGKDGEEDSASDEERFLPELWNTEFERDLIFPDDRGNVEKLINMSYMRKFFAEYQGKEYFWVRYRKMVNEEYHPFRLEVFPAEEYSDDNQVVYFYFMDLNGKLYQESTYVGELLQSLSENYEGIYYVDFDKDITIPYRMSRVINDNFGAFFRTNPSYETAMMAYVKAAVAKKDLQEMIEIARADYVKEKLRYMRAFSHEFTVIRNGKELTYRFKISKVNEGSELHHAVVGFAEVTGEKTHGMNYYRSFKKIMIVSENLQTIHELQKILNENYSTVTAENTQDAMQMLENMFKEISVILMEFSESDQEAYELIRKLKTNDNYRDIPVIVVSEKNAETNAEIQAEVKCLELGAEDFILKPFIPDIVQNRIKSLIRLRESTAMLSLLERDPLTGLYSKEFFFKKVEDYLSEHPNQKFMFWVSDIQWLKVINEKYGFEKGD